jgi:SAM-dependent methyltransferase
VALDLTDALTRVRTVLLDDSQLVRAVGAGRRRGHDMDWRRVEMRYIDLKSGRHLQVTTYDDAQAHTRNHLLGAPAAGAVDRLLALPFANWHVDTTESVMQMRVTKRGDALLHIQPIGGERESGHAHDRAKSRLVDPREPWLHAIGISDHQGQVKPSRQGKYRQVEEFVRLLAPAVEDALESGQMRRPTATQPLRVVDLGCGNAYLTFAAYRHLSRSLGLPVAMVGVDHRQQSRDRNAALAEELGWEGGASFEVAPIGNVELAEAPDVVLALHACDTATDDALARAVRWGACLVLAAPCCHHDLQTQLQHSQSPGPYGMLTRHGIVRERFADVLTDALRASLLRLYGYRVEVVQFVGTEHTPRNTLIRAIRTNAPPTQRLREEYVELTEAWRVTPALARALPDLTERALAS